MKEARRTWLNMNVFFSEKFQVIIINLVLCFWLPDFASGSVIAGDYSSLSERLKLAGSGKAFDQVEGS
jgi:hypothetical protein